MSKFIFTAILVAISAFTIEAKAAPAYQIVSEDGSSGAQTLTVRLDARQSDQDLKSLAEAIKSKRPANKQPGKIAFFLRAMKLSQTAWAEARFDPVTKITVNGLRYDEEEAFKAEAATDPRAIVGVWLTSAPALPGKMTIWRDRSGKLFSEWRLRNGQKTVDQLSETQSQRGRRYEIQGSDGGYYLATWNGDLELGEKAAVIAVAERLVLTPSMALAKTAKAASSTAAIQTGSTAIPAIAAAGPAVTAPAGVPLIPKSKSLQAGTSKRSKVLAQSGAQQGPKAGRPLPQTFSDAISGTYAR